MSNVFEKEMNKKLVPAPVVHARKSSSWDPHQSWNCQTERCYYSNPCPKTFQMATILLYFVCLFWTLDVCSHIAVCYGIQRSFGFLKLYPPTYSELYSFKFQPGSWLSTLKAHLRIGSQITPYYLTNCCCRKAGKNFL